MAYKRFLLFTYDQYYPIGGEHDVNGSYDTLKEAVDFSRTSGYEHAEVLDMKERKFFWNTWLNDR